VAERVGLSLQDIVRLSVGLGLKQLAGKFATHPSDVDSGAGLRGARVLRVSHASPRQGRATPWGPQNRPLLAIPRGSPRRISPLTRSGQQNQNQPPPPPCQYSAKYRPAKRAGHRKS
jgi:hypothetical protein